ncbi:MAG: glycosyltransferase family 2 protein [Aeromicrobium sp.]|nr:glycosyltransferase family 2 protein [Burkholderiales bacterium]
MSNPFTSAPSHSNIEVSVVMPCLNEERTILACIVKAQSSFRKMKISGEVVIADNGSTDRSVEIAEGAGARVVFQPVRGYGAALLAGIDAALGEIVVMGDADDSYDWSEIEPMVRAVRERHSLVVGNRFQGGIRPGAMPFLHRYLGNPVLSFIGRLFFRSPIGDFHCGMRAFRKSDITQLQLRTTGMEFASEMIVKASLQKLSIGEVPVVLSPDGRDRPPHLRTWRDGWRHLRFLLLYSPRWLFLLPGAFLFAVGLLGMLVIGSNSLVIGRIGLDIHTLAYAGAFVVLGMQMLLFAGFSKFIGQEGGWLPENPRFSKLVSLISLELGLILSLALFFGAVLLSVGALGIWSDANFGGLDPRVTMRWVVPAVTMLALSGEILLASFFLEVLRMRIQYSSSSATVSTKAKQEVGQS